MKWRWKAPTPLVAGVTATAGDVVFTGDLNGNFLVFDARDGSKLFTFNTGGPIAGGVITWEQDGKQRVAVTPGNSGQGWDLAGQRDDHHFRIVNFARAGETGDAKMVA